MIQRCFGNALHWYQVLTAMANHEVDTWIWNMASVAAAPDEPSNASSTENTTEEGITNLTPHSSSISEGDCPIQSHTGFNKPPQETAISSLQLVPPDLPPLPFPLPKDFPCMEEDVPIANA